MTHCSPGEVRAIRTVLELAEQYGYGNLISHLATAWEHKSGAWLCLKSATMPYQMHRDIVERGEWDETGKSYAPAAAKDSGQGGCTH